MNIFRVYSLKFISLFLELDLVVFEHANVMRKQYISKK